MAASKGKPDYYEILGVDRRASQEEIKQAYRRLAREHHPDVRKDDPHATERFKQINEAYQVLSDPDKRGRYDRFGHEGFQGAGRGVDADLRDFTSPFDDIFDAFFGTGARRGASRDPDEPARGVDLRLDLEVSLEDVASGADKEVTLTRLETCATCFGTGAEKGGGLQECPTCRGAGEVRYVRQTFFGQFAQVTTCSRCGGRGKVLRNPCKTCRGSGRVPAERTLTVHVPAGVDDGMRLRLAGEGEAGTHGGPRGDLYAFLNLAPHPVFERDGRHVWCEVPVSMAQAALGDEVEVPTLEGTATMAIPAGAQPGAVLTLEGKGLPDLKGRRGDQHVRLRVEIPTELSKEERRLLLQFAKTRGEKIKPQSKNLVEKVKDLLS
ncbi:MAG: molecular chaperone DnaJ [Armatimonadetes bacterium]|nr:molecular chaperone DnaJ [Armatimonadota bacterium]